MAANFKGSPLHLLNEHLQGEVVQYLSKEDQKSFLTALGPITLRTKVSFYNFIMNEFYYTLYEYQLHNNTCIAFQKLFSEFSQFHQSRSKIHINIEFDIKNLKGGPCNYPKYLPDKCTYTFTISNIFEETHMFNEKLYDHHKDTPIVKIEYAFTGMKFDNEPLNPNPTNSSILLKTIVDNFNIKLTSSLNNLNLFK